uniref:Uncharacterized protein n=1 Tax=Meloidogyne hapla TaxID=6305 RepID=A0A1I8BAD7_MELHA
MDSNSSNLTQQNMTSDTSLTSSEDEFVYLNGTKTKGTMTAKMDLIPKDTMTNNDLLNHINMRFDELTELVKRNLPKTAGMDLVPKMEKIKGDELLVDSGKTINDRFNELVKNMKMKLNVQVYFLLML